MKTEIKRLRFYFQISLMCLLVFLGINEEAFSHQSSISSKNIQVPIPYVDSLITLLSPNGGEIWEPGTTEFIKWNGLNVSNLKIDYSTDNGISWNIVYSNISSASDSVNWVIPNTPSQQCLIRISDVNNTSIADTSNSVFMISSGGWVPQNSGITNTLYSIDFLNDSLGYCAGIDGIILKTTNGGENWEMVYYDSDLWIRAVHIISTQKIIAVGYTGLILLTSDGGVTWNQIPAVTSKMLYAVQFINNEIGWILSDDGTILKSIDGGFSWNLSLHNQNTDWYSSSFIDSLTGWIVGRYGTISKTTDGGVSWVDQITNTTQTLYSVDFVDSDYGWVVGYSGTILNTTDGGINWLVQQGGTSTWLQTVEFVNRDTGWVGGWYGKLLKTRNGGGYWSTQPIPTNENIQWISFPNENNGWAVGDDGGIFKYSSGIGGITITKPNGGELIKESSDYLITWLSFGVDSVLLEFSSDAGVNWEIINSAVPTNSSSYLWQVPNVLSDQCLIKITDKENVNTYDICDNVFSIVNWGWFQQFLSTGNNLSSIYFTSQDTGWITGSGGTIFRTFDGGQSWQEQQSGVGTKLNSIFFINNTNGWAVGDNGSLILTSNSGLNWSFVNTNTIENLQSVYFVSNQLGWVAGTNGTIIKTTDGGFNWFPLDEPENSIYNSLFFITSNTGVVVDNDGFINRTTNGGSSWQFVGSSPYYPLYSIYFTDQNYGYAVGSYGTILRSSNSGSNWIYLTETLDIYFRSVYFTHPSTGWTVGLNGVIWGTTNYGDNWYEYSSGITKDLYSVFFTDPNIGWAVGEGGTLLKYIPLRTESITVLQPNGGENWQHGSTYPITWLSTDVEYVKIEYSIDDGCTWNNISTSVPAADGSFLWDVPNTPTLDGRIKISDVSDGGIFDICDTSFAISTEEHGWFKLPVNISSSLNSVHFENENLGWAVGNDGNIMKTTDGGYNWVNQNSGTYDYFTEVEFVNNNTGWVIGLDGTILKTSNGGSIWTSQQGTIISSLESESFIDANNGWILSYYGKIFHTTNGGTDWSLQFQLPDGYYYSIKFINNLKGWVSGNLTPWNESVIYKTIDGGQSWQNSYLNLYTAGVLDLYFVNENYGCGVGIHGVNMLTVNGGTSWSVLTQGFNNWLYSVHSISEFHSWAVGDEGTILNTTDGYNWINQVSGTEERFNSIYMVNDWVGYIVTQNGNIFKTNSGGFIPVELTTFAATVENYNVSLKWQTATETNNQGFQIERSKKLEAKSGKWESIGFVNR